MAMPAVLAANLAPLQRRWQAMSVRDQRALLGLGSFFVVVVLWMLVIAPAFRYADNARERLANVQRDLAWMTQHANEARQAAASAQRAALPPGQSLLTLVSGSAGEAGINLQRFEPDGDQRVRVSLENAVFTDVMRWVATLEQRYGLKVSSFTADGVTEAGVANIRLTVGQ